MARPRGLEKLLMNGRRFVFSCWSVLFGMILSASAAEARVLPPDAGKPAIEQFINEQAEKLKGEDFAAAKEARTAIVGEVAPGVPGQPAPSAAFLDAYAEAANAALQPLVKHELPRVRLNAAIVAARVAEGVNNAKLMPTIVDALNDQTEAVVHWGIKGAKFVIPPVLSNAMLATNNPLMPAFLNAVKKYGKSGPLIQAAYDALRIEDKGPNAVAPANMSKVLPVVIDAIQTVMEIRLAQYQDGVPAMPSAEQTAILFLTKENVWNAKTGQEARQRLRTVQIMSDLVAVAAFRAQNAGTIERADLVDVLRKTGSAFQVIGPSLGADSLVEVGKRLSGIQPTMAAAEIQQRVDGVHPVLSKISVLAGVKPPPKLSAAASAPTTAPDAAP